jgi:hypothetical protein
VTQTGVARMELPVILVSSCQPVRAGSEGAAVPVASPAASGLAS